MRRANRSSDGVERKTLRLGRELQIRQYCVLWKRGRRMSTDLDLGANVEESKITGNQMMSDTSSLILQIVSITSRKVLQVTYQDVNLTTQDILALLEVIVRRASRAGLDLVEARCDVSGGIGLCADGMEVGDSGVLALGQRDEFVAGALDDGERDEFRHFWRFMGYEEYGTERRDTER